MAGFAAARFDWNSSLLLAVVLLLMDPFAGLEAVFPAPWLWIAGALVSAAVMLFSLRVKHSRCPQQVSGYKKAAEPDRSEEDFLFSMLIIPQNFRKAP